MNHVKSEQIKTYLTKSDSKIEVVTFTVRKALENKFPMAVIREVVTAICSTDQATRVLEAEVLLHQAKLIGDCEPDGDIEEVTLGKVTCEYCDSEEVTIIDTEYSCQSACMDCGLVQGDIKFEKEFDCSLSELYCDRRQCNHRRKCSNRFIACGDINCDQRKDAEGHVARINQ